MKLKSFIEEIPSVYTPTWELSNQPEIDIYSIQLLKKQSHLREGVLYLGFADDIPISIPCANVSMLLLTPSRFEFPRMGNCNLIRVDNHMDFSLFYDEISNILEVDIQISYDKHKLLNLFLHSNSSMSEKVNLAHSFLRNPIILIDASSKIIGMSQDAVHYRSDLKEQHKFGYLSSRNMEHLKKNRIYENVRKTRYPYYDNQEYLRNGWMHGHIYIQNVEVAHIAVIEVNHPFSKYDFEIVDFLCSLISSELEKDQVFKKNKGLNHSFFLSELLKNQITSSSVLNFRLNQINWKINSQFVVFCVFMKDNNQTNAELFAERISVYFPNNRWIVFDNNIIFIVSSDNMDVSLFLENEFLLDYLKTNKLSSSVSNSFDSLINTSKYYQQAIIAYDLGNSLNKGDYLYVYENYMIYHLISIFNKESYLETAFYSKVLKIIEYDEQYNTNLLETLNEYITHINNPSLVSSNLHIHKNTLFYRINKIKDNFALDLSDGDVRFNIQLTIKLLHFSKYHLQ